MIDRRQTEELDPQDCTHGHDPTERTLTEVRTDLGTSPTDKD